MTYDEYQKLHTEWHETDCNATGMERMRRCRWHEAFCLDDDCKHPRHKMTIPCDSDMPLHETCASCADFEN